MALRNESREVPETRAVARVGGPEAARPELAHFCKEVGSNERHAFSELAGRGLYGDYALFLPAEVLSRDGSDGLDLDRVTDVLLRLEYVSVAR
jgi:hypothetical protein